MLALTLRIPTEDLTNLTVASEDTDDDDDDPHDPGESYLLIKVI